MNDTDDECYAECGDCGEQLPPLTPWKSNPCDNKACPSQLWRAATTLDNASNGAPDDLRDELRRIAADLRAVYQEVTA